MTMTIRYLFLAAVMSGLAGAAPAFAQATGDVRVRTSNAAIAALVQHATQTSRTFRGLVDTINASDGIVYIEDGRCSHGRRACFVAVTRAGELRILWVKLDTRGGDDDLIELIGHELRHTVEVLAAPRVTSAFAMYFFYSQSADTRRSGAVFETLAAIKAGEAVRAEIDREGRSGR